MFLAMWQGRVVELFLEALYWICMVTLALFLAALCDAAVVYAAEYTPSVEFVVARVVAAGWLAACAASGSRLLRNDGMAILLGPHDRSTGWNSALIASTATGAALGVVLFAWSDIVFFVGTVDSDSGYDVPARTWAQAHLFGVLLFPLKEEIVYRLGVQTFLVHRWRDYTYGTMAALVVTAIVFSLAHTGSIEEYGIKMIEIFPISLVLGVVFLRWGLVASLAAHSILNLLSGGGVV
jgi:membrane protease YdiL (CAAX protease family)